jgi:peptide-methionine (R)-S-oxide reductase
MAKRIVMDMENDEQLKRENPQLYKIAKEGGTEAPFTGKYVNEKSDGMYHCAVCGTALFTSDAKFDSRSGWPSFTDPAVGGAVTLHEDDALGMVRTEVRCKNCGAHLGHVFPDGPIKNGKTCDRYCINSVSLELKKKDNG